MKRFFYSIILCSLLTPVLAQHHLDWVNVPYIANHLTQYIDDMVVDPAGNIYTRQLLTDQQPGTTNITYYKQLVKQDAFGNVLWQKGLGSQFSPEDNQWPLIVQRSNFIYTPVLEYGRVQLLKLNELTGALDTVFSRTINYEPTANYDLKLTAGNNGHLFVYMQVYDTTAASYVYEVSNDTLVQTGSLHPSTGFQILANSDADMQGNIYTLYIAGGSNPGSQYVHLCKMNAGGTLAHDVVLDTIGAITPQFYGTDSAGNSYFMNNSMVTKVDAQLNTLWTYNTNGFYAWRYNLNKTGDLFLLMNNYYATQAGCLHLRNNGTVAYNYPIPISRYGNDAGLNINAAGEAYLSCLQVGMPHKQAVLLTLLDTAGQVKEMLSDTIFYAMDLGIDESRKALNSNGDFYYNFSFINPGINGLADTSAALLNIKNSLWYTIKLCAACGLNDVSGRVVLDTIPNCAADSLEPAAKNSLVQLNPGTRMSTLDAGGAYKFSNVPAGSYSVAVVPPPYLNATCDSTFALSIDSTNPAGFHDFELTAQQTCGMYLQVNGTRARSGFKQQTDVNYYNEMYQPVNGMVAVTLDSLFMFASSIPAPDSISAPTYFFKYSNLQPYYNQLISIWSVVDSIPFFDMDSFIVTAAVYSSCTQGNVALATDTLSDFIYSSFDPNEKDVYPLKDRRYGQFTDKQQALTFQINFQNTGNDTAFRIVVRDTIDTNLNLSTLKLLGSSKPCSFAVGPNRDAQWTFENIQLPDSAVNLTGSQAYLKYSIMPNANLQYGEQVKNRASIYFDYNDPVLTNRVSLQYDSTFTNGLFTPAAQSPVRLYPNPAANQIYIETAGAAIAQLNIYTATGKLIMQAKQPAGNSFNISQLSAGFYIAEIKTATGGVAMVKWVKM